MITKTKMINVPLTLTESCSKTTQHVHQGSLNTTVEMIILVVIIDRYTFQLVFKQDQIS